MLHQAFVKSLSATRGALVSSLSVSSCIALPCVTAALSRTTHRSPAFSKQSKHALLAPFASPSVRSFHASSVNPLLAKTEVVPQEDLASDMDSEFDMQQAMQDVRTISELVNVEIQTAEEDPLPLPEALMAPPGWEYFSEEGSNEVSITRKSENETITITFSPTFEDDDESRELKELMNEQNLDDAFEGSTMFGSREGKTEDQLEQEREEGKKEDEPAPQHIPFEITIQKKDGRCLRFFASAFDTRYEIHMLSHYPDEKLATSLEPAYEVTRSSMYPGPQFKMLDPELALAFHVYLYNKGVDGPLIGYVCDVATLKETQSYIQWLKDIHNFVRGDPDDSQPAEALEAEKE